MTIESDHSNDLRLPVDAAPQPVVVVIVGLGYAGLTLALKLAEAGVRVVGVDTLPERVAQLNAGVSHVHETGLLELLQAQLQTYFTASTEIPVGADVFVIAVGTPAKSVTLSAPPTPDLTFLSQAAAGVGAKLKRGGLVVIRSTVPVGATRQWVLPALETASGLRAGVDFQLAFAPERTVEGKALVELRTLPQIIGGFDELSTQSTAALFRTLAPSIVPMESMEAAELAKLLNNSFRDYVFAFANQVTQLASAHNIDVFRCIKNANQDYPRDPIPLPSPGVGGPCLTKDPWIFASMAHAAASNTLSAHARVVNDSMIGFVADSVADELRRLGKDTRIVRVIACGMAFKGRPETGDLRNSTSVDIVRRLVEYGFDVSVHDPVATASELAEFGLKIAPAVGNWHDFDALLLLNNHGFYSKLDLSQVLKSMRHPGLVYDAWRLLNSKDVLAIEGVTYMGLGFRRGKA